MGKPPIKAYVDGASSGGTGGPGGWGVVLIEQGGDVLREMSGGHPSTTNQRMEIVAACEALENIEEPSYVTVYSDSAYVVNCMRRQWHKRWSRNGWVNSEGCAVANRDLWDRLLKAVGRHLEVDFRKVKGHSNDWGNNRADDLAVSAKRKIVAASKGV